MFWKRKKKQKAEVIEMFPDKKEKGPKYPENDLRRELQLYQWKVRYMKATGHMPTKKMEQAMEKMTEMTNGI